MSNLIQKKAKFIDNKGNPQSATIRINPGMFIGIDSFDQNNNQTGYIRIYFHPNNRLYLDTIYCLDKFRGNGIATMLSELADYIMKEQEGYVIRGLYNPTQMWTDRENNIVRSVAELDTAAKKFYTKNGYEVIHYEDYMHDPEKYPYIEFMDFQLGEKIAKTIVAKVIVPKSHMFMESDGVIYHTNDSTCKQKSYK